MKPRLLIDVTVLDFVGRLKKRDRDFLFHKFTEIQQSASSHADYRDADESGRTLDVHIAGRFAISYWDDFADRHLKIMAWIGRTTFFDELHCLAARSAYGPARSLSAMPP